MSLDRRLGKLEDLAGGGRAWTPPHARIWERYFHAHENARRELEGREPLPELPYTDEDREDDRRFLEDTMPAYRALAGWQSGSIAQA